MQVDAEETDVLELQTLNDVIDQDESDEDVSYLKLRSLFSIGC